MIPGDSYEWATLSDKDAASLATGTRVALLAPAGHLHKGDALEVNTGTAQIPVRVVRVSDWTATRDWVEVVRS